MKPVLQKLSNSELFCTIIPGRIHGTRTCHGKILELRVCALENSDSGISVDRSYPSIRNPFMENSKMSVTEKCKKYLLGYRLSKNSRTEAFSSGRSVHRDGDDSNHRSSRSSSNSSVNVSGGNEKAKHRVLARSGSQIQEVVQLSYNSSLFFYSTNTILSSYQVCRMFCLVLSYLIEY